MCELQAKVAREVTGYGHPADCFCGESGFHPLADPDNYRNDFAAIEWIEETVAAALMPSHNDKTPPGKMAGS
jgi:hypothetical protein